MIVWKWTLMVTLDRKLFQNYYCSFSSETFITALLVTPYNSVLKEAINAEKISLSVILHYINYFHSNKTLSALYKFMCGCECFISSKSIHKSSLSRRDQYFKNSNIKSNMLKKVGLVKKKITYMKHIKI